MQTPAGQNMEHLQPSDPYKPPPNYGPLTYPEGLAKYPHGASHTPKGCEISSLPAGENGPSSVAAMERSPDV